MEPQVMPPRTKGLIISGILIVYTFALYFAGQLLNRSISMIPFGILVLAIILSNIHFAKQKKGNVTFGNVFAYGFKTTAAVIVIMVAFTFTAFKFIYPEMAIKMQEITRTEMLSSGGTKEQVEQALQNWKDNFYVFICGGIMLMYGICGAIGSMVGANLARKNPSYHPSEQS